MQVEEDFYQTTISNHTTPKPGARVFRLSK
jgi:hypothetical protein